MSTSKNEKGNVKGKHSKSPGKPGKPAKTPTYSELYDYYLPAAMSVPEASVQICRADVRVAFANIRLGIKSVLGTEEQIALSREHLPKVPLDEVLELPNIARALVFAVGKVSGRVASPKEIDQKLSLISGPREQMLSQAEILAKRGKLDKDRVAKIRAGSGKYDSAHDVVALVDIFTKEAESLKGLHPFTGEELEAAREAAEWLLESLTPEGARAEKKKQKSPAEEIRDRLWSIVVARHALLRRIGYYFHGDDVDLYVPRLQSRVAQAVIEEESNAGTAEPEAGKPGSP
jgi:hypothetical protein